MQLVTLQAKLNHCQATKNWFMHHLFHLAGDGLGLFDNSWSVICQQSNLEQVANLLCSQVNSASYPPWDKKWVRHYRLWGEGLVWLIGVVVCLLAAPLVQLFADAGNGWPHRVLRYH